VTSIEIEAFFTRTGRAFFSEAEMSDALLARIRAAMDAADFWDRFETGWARLDTKLMASSATVVLDEAVALLEKAGKAGLEMTDFLAEFMERNARADQYV
jgi:protein phosphatase